MRLCFFTHIAGLGGAERSLLQLIGDLIGRHDVDCTVVTPSDGPLIERLRAIGATVDVLPYRWWVHGPRDQAAWQQHLVPDAVAVLDYVNSKLRASPPDMIVTHGIVTPWGAVAAAVLGLPHAWHICEIPGGAFNFRFATDDSLLVADIARSSNLVFMPAVLVAPERLAALGARRVVIVPRHIDIPPPDPAAVSYFHVPGALRLGMYSSYNPAKGHMDALQAVRRLVEAGRNVELLCAGPIGEPDWYDRLRAYVDEYDLSGSVRLLGNLDNPYDAMRASDAVLALGRHEAFGRTALEGMLLGKAVVYADDGISFRYMRHEATGLGYPAGDAVALAGLLRRLQDAPETRLRLGLQAQAYAAATFTRENFSGRFFEACREVLATDRTPRPMPSLIAPVVDAAMRGAVTNAV